MKTLERNTQFDVIQKGYRVLEKEMGPTDSLRFIMSFYSGSGDSVKKYRNLWKNFRIDKIYKTIKTNL